MQGEQPTLIRWRLVRVRNELQEHDCKIAERKGELGEFETFDGSIDFVEYKDISLSVIYCDLRCDAKNEFQHKTLEILQVEEVNLFFDPQTSEPFISAMVGVGLIVSSSFLFMAAYRNPNFKSKIKTIKAGMVRWREKHSNKKV